MDPKIRIESAPKPTAHKSETKPIETLVNQTSRKPNPCNPPMPKAPLKTNLRPLEPWGPLDQTKPVIEKPTRYGGLKGVTKPEEIEVNQTPPKPNSEPKPKPPKHTTSLQLPKKPNQDGGGKLVKGG